MTTPSGLLRWVPVPVRRMGGFALMPVLSVLSNVVLLPVISHLFGTAGWTSVLIGQGIGAAASVVVSLQWMAEGPALIARTEPRLRGAVLRASTRSRAVALLVVIPVIGLAVLVAGPDDRVTAFVAALGAAAIGLSPSWYFVGTGQPSRLILLEGLPRLGGNLVSLGLLLTGSPLWTFPAVMLLVALGATGVAQRSQTRQHPDERWTSPRRARATGLATLARTMDAGTGFAAGPLVAALAPVAYPLFGACDRLTKVLLNGLAVVPQGAAGWISEPDDAAHRLHRARRVTLLLVPIAGLIAVALALTAPVLVHLLFAGTVAVPLSTSVLAGAALATTFLAQATFYSGLASTGQAAHGYRYLLIGSVVGLTGLVVGALTLGTDGALAGIVAQGTVMYALSLRRVLRTDPADHVAPTTTDEELVQA